MKTTKVNNIMCLYLLRPKLFAGFFLSWAENAKLCEANGEFAALNHSTAVLGLLRLFPCIVSKSVADVLDAVPVVEHVFVHGGCVVGAGTLAHSFESSYGYSVPGHGAELIFV